MATATRSRTKRSSAKRDHSIGAEIDRHVLRPVSKGLKSAQKSVSKTPAWLGITLGVVAVAGIAVAVFGLSGITEFFGMGSDSSDEFEGMDYSSDDYAA
jgi:hypothetical protein